MKDITVTCLSPACHNTKTGPRAELILWRCPEHTYDNIEVGERVQWHDKRYQVLAIEKGQVRLRTGAKGGKLVSRKDVMKL